MRLVTEATAAAAATAFSTASAGVPRATRRECRATSDAADRARGAKEAPGRMELFLAQNPLDIKAVRVLMIFFDPLAVVRTTKPKGTAGKRFGHKRM